MEDTGLEAVKPVVSAVVLQDPALTNTLTVNIVAIYVFIKSIFCGNL